MILKCTVQLHVSIAAEQFCWLIKFSTAYLTEYMSSPITIYYQCTKSVLIIQSYCSSCDCEIPFFSYLPVHLFQLIQLNLKCTPNVHGRQQSQQVERLYKSKKIKVKRLTFIAQCIFFSDVYAIIMIEKSCSSSKKYLKEMGHSNLNIWQVTI